jgi:hypothetical protein
MSCKVGSPEARPSVAGACASADFLEGVPPGMVRRNSFAFDPCASHPRRQSLARLCGRRLSLFYSTFQALLSRSVEQWGDAVRLRKFDKALFDKKPTAAPVERTSEMYPAVE